MSSMLWFTESLVLICGGQCLACLGEISIRTLYPCSHQSPGLWKPVGPLTVIDSLGSLIFPLTALFLIDFAMS